MENRTWPLKELKLGTLYEESAHIVRGGSCVLRYLHSYVLAVLTRSARSSANLHLWMDEAMWSRHSGVSLRRAVRRVVTGSWGRGQVWGGGMATRCVDSDRGRKSSGVYLTAGRLYTSH